MMFGGLMMLLFWGGLLFAFAVISAAIGLFWVRRLPKVTELEPAEAVFAPEVSTVPAA